MTDNEIIKALECCTDCKCKECPCYNKETDGCTEIDEEEILDLITRQKAEVERLQIRNKALTEITKNYDWKFSKVKVEAYKEFAERLKAKASSTFWEERKYVDAEDIDDVLAELTEHKQTVSMIDGHIEE